MPDVFVRYHSIVLLPLSLSLSASRSLKYFHYKEEKRSDRRARTAA